MDQLNVLDADLPTMVVRCNNTLVLRSVITGQHIEVIGSVPCWRDRPIPVEASQRNELIEREFTKALEAVISLIPKQLQQKKMTAKRVAEAEAAAAAKTECNNNAERRVVQLPPCKVQRNYSCSHCSFYTQNPRSHLLHQRDVHGVRLSIHTCQHCQYASRYCQKLKRHVKMVHSGGGPQDPAIKIEKPNVPFSNYGEIILKPNETKTENAPHPMMKPPNEIKMETAGCSKNLISKPIVNIQSDPEAFFVSAYKNQLQQFEKDHQLKKLNNSNTGQIHQISSQVAKQPKEALSNNQASTNNDKPLNLSEGQATAINGEYDKKHLYGCRKCSYITHIKSRYNKHVKYHSMPMIQCNICEFRTTYKWNLTRHLRNHHGNGIYKCSICSFSANMKQSLSSHELNHHSPPIGSAARNKTTKKRRCRVGGSDLQAECNSGPTMENNITNCITNPGTETTDTLSCIEPKSYRTEENNVAVDLSLSNNKNNVGSNENDLGILQKSLPYQNSMDNSDIEFSNPQSSDYSDVETSDIDSSNSSSGLQNPIIAPPLHIDADYINNDDLQMASNECNNKLTPLSTITTENIARITNTAMQGMDLTKKFHHFNRSSSSSTMSADETSHRMCGNISSSSSQSSKPSNKDIPSYAISPILSAPSSLCEWTSDDNFSDSSQECENDMEV